MNFSKFLNPFTYIAGTKTLLWGLCGILITSIFASFGPIHLDGVIDIHIGLRDSEGWTLGQNLFMLGEGLIDWITLSCVLSLASLILSKSKVRIIDLLGTQAFARLPMLLPVFIGMFIPLEKTSAYILYKVGNMGIPVDGINALQIILFILFMLSTLISIIWAIIWMYKAYSISANLTKAKAVVSFIIAIILAEIITKLIFLPLQV